jgi:hypothetical protein
MEPVTTQQALAATVWVKGTVALEPSGTVTDAAMLVSFPYGENGGRVFHSSFANYLTVTAETKTILKNVFFAL